MRTEETWRVVKAEGAFYTLERSGHQLDFMKMAIQRPLVPGEQVLVACINGLRTIKV